MPQCKNIRIPKFSRGKKKIARYFIDYPYCELLNKLWITEIPEYLREIYFEQRGKQKKIQISNLSTDFLGKTSTKNVGKLFVLPTVKTRLRKKNIIFVYQLAAKSYQFPPYAKLHPSKFMEVVRKADKSIGRHTKKQNKLCEYSY